MKIRETIERDIPPELEDAFYNNLREIGWTSHQIWDLQRKGKTMRIATDPGGIVITTIEYVVHPVDD